LERVERQYFANGSLREEIHYLGSLEHGPWRSWHPNGVLASEYWFERGRYVNCVNRTWDECGRLLGECVWVDGTMIEARVFDKDGERITEDTIAAKARAAERAFGKVKDTAYRGGESGRETNVIRQLLQSRRRDAAEWLGEAADLDSRCIGPLDRERASALVRQLVKLGAVRVLAVELQTTPGTTSESTNHLLVELPDGLGARQRLFEFEADHAIAQGYDPVGDTGEQYLYLKFC
jgi:hypothetical protein